MGVTGSRGQLGWVSKSWAWAGLGRPGRLGCRGGGGSDGLPGRAGIYFLPVSDLTPLCLHCYICNLGTVVLPISWGDLVHQTHGNGVCMQ